MERNRAWFDGWSLVHLASGIVGGWLFHPVLALALLYLWEPFEIFLLGPLIRRKTGIHFGHEGWQNSVSDLLFDTAGVLIGWWFLRAWWSPFVWP